MAKMKKMSKDIKKYQKILKIKYKQKYGKKSKNIENTDKNFFRLETFEKNVLRNTIIIFFNINSLSHFYAQIISSNKINHKILRKKSYKI